MTKEEERLIEMLKRFNDEVNKVNTNYHASVDVSGTTPQLSIRGGEK